MSSYAVLNRSAKKMLRRSFLISQNCVLSITLSQLSVYSDRPNEDFPEWNVSVEVTGISTTLAEVIIRVKRDMAYGQVRETSTVQLSGQTKGMHEGIDSGLPRANFPRKISKEDLRTTAVSQNK